MQRTRRMSLLVLPLVAAAACSGNESTIGGINPESTSLRDVVLVGNAVSGTVSFLDGHTFQNLGSVNILPDFADRMAAINGDLIHSIAYGIVKSKEVIKHFEPSNGDRFTDDVFVSPDGGTLYVSRCNLGDVAAFDLTHADHKILWRTDIDGYKADHATLSPDGKRLIVSATAVDKAIVLDAATGAVVSNFATGHYPHQNDFSADGKHIYNGSIGDVSLPSLFDFFKGFRFLTVVDSQTYQPVRSYLFSEGIRPSVVTADEKILYANLSYLNGVIKYDLVNGREIARLDQPLSDFAKANYPTKDDYPHDSAHHGLSMSGDGSRLCDLGTIDNTVSIVRTADLSLEKTIPVGLIPYWSTTSADGNHCLVSLSGENAISVIDIKAGAEVAHVAVGKFPQRNRLGQVPDANLALLSKSGG